LLRMRLVKSFVSEPGNTWLMEEIVRTCIEFGDRLNDKNDLDRNLLAQIELVLAFVLLEYQEDDEGIDIDVSVDCLNVLNELVP